MDKHLLKFHLGIYADRFAVTNPRIYSTHPKARALEESLKQERPEFSDVWPKIKDLPAPERNFITAVFVAWAYEANFFRALASGLLSAEIWLWQDTGDDEFPDNYYTYEWTAAQYRKVALDEQLEHHRDEVRHIADQLSRFDVRVAELAT